MPPTPRRPQSLWQRFFGSAVSTAAGFSIGAAVGPTLNPLTQALANETWSLHADVPPDAYALAMGVAQGQIEDDRARSWAAETGIGSEQFSALVQIANTGPEAGSLYEAWRRGQLTDAQFETGLRRMAIEPEWFPALKALKQRLLSPDVLANAIQQGFIPGDGILVAPPGGSVPFTIPVDQVNIDATDEAAGSGVPADHLRVLAQLAGNPPGPMELIDMWNRGIITEESVDRGIREGRTKTKWLEAIKELRHYLLSPAEAAGLRLRGWITAEQSYEIGARRGADRETMDRLFLNRGRPIAPVQAYTAWARASPSPYTAGAFSREDFDKAIAQSDIRPEYANTLWGNRFAYPSLFQLRAAVQDGGISRERALEIMHFQRYEDSDALAIVTAWLSGDAQGREITKAELQTEYEGGFITRAELATALGELGYEGVALERELNLSDARAVRTERRRLITALHRLFVKHKLSDEQARAGLEEAGMTLEAIARIMPLWTLERDAEQTTLTPAQIRRAYRAGRLTLAQAIDELEERGYLTADADLYLTT
jgi:hypothetical protein